MRFSEFHNDLHLFKVTVRVKNDSGSMTINTMVCAESMAQAQFLIRHLFGKDSVVRVTYVQTHENMTEATKVLSPQELQVKSLVDKAKDYKRQANVMKARQRMAKSQQDLAKAIKG